MRVVIAARLSRLGTNGQDGIGIETQDQRAREWAEREGHEVVKVVADTKSGTVAPWDRKNLKPWVTDQVKMAQYDAILAYKNDRLSRGMWSDEARIRQWAEDHGKRLMIVDGPQWPPRNDGDEWSWEAMSKMARKEWEAIRERSMRAQNELRSRGSFLGRPPEFYTTAGDKYERYLTPTDEGRVHVPVIYQMAIDGQPMAAIAAYLDDQGIKPRSKRRAGSGWWEKSIGDIIRNPVYRGARCERDAKTKRYGRLLHECEPLVDAATWKAANDNLDARPKRGKVFAKNRAMLATALFCPRCGTAMYRIKSGNGNTHLYYRCFGRGPQRKGCGLMVDAALVDTAADRAMSMLNEARVQWVPRQRPDYEAELTQIGYAKQQLMMSGLGRAEEDAGLAALRAREDEVRVDAEEEKNKPDFDEVATGESYAELWAALPVYERGPWLTREHLRLTASREKVIVYAISSKPGRRAQMMATGPIPVARRSVA